MLLDIGSVLGGIGLAVVGFVVVVLVCVVILRLLAVILPSYEDRPGSAAKDESVSAQESDRVVSGDELTSAEVSDRAGSVAPDRVDPSDEPPE